MSAKFAIDRERLGYMGKADLRAFGFSKYCDGKYEPSFLPSGAPMGTPKRPSTAPPKCTRRVGNENPIAAPCSLEVLAVKKALYTLAEAGV